MEQLPFADISLAQNPETRCACVLLLDVSGSMHGRPIAELNAGLVTFKDELAADSLASKRVEIAIVTFGGEVRTPTTFVTADSFQPPPLSASGDTPMGNAIRLGIEILERRKEEYRSHGVQYYRPWIFLITDGGPTDEWKSAAQAVQNGMARKQFLFFPVGVDGANFDVLKQISPETQPLRLDGTRFRDLFSWLSSSLKSTSHSKPGDHVPLENPTGPKGWGSADT